MNACLFCRNCRDRNEIAESQCNINALCKCDASATRANQFRSFLLAAITQNVCQLESLSAECPRDAVMVVTSARYGRMRLSRCADHDFGHLGCHSDVQLLLERKCSGRRRCALPVPNADLEATRPCHIISYALSHFESTHVTSVSLS